MRAAVKSDREVSVERVEDPSAPRVRIAAPDSRAEVDAEARATEAMAVQRDWQPDLSGARLHDGPDAARAASAIGAAAFTRGSDVYLGADVQRGTPEGDHVLAHELAHVEQHNDPNDIHRYPDTALTQGPVDWAGETADVFRPGGGISGGVYIMTARDQDGGVKKVVAKPVMGENALGTKETGESLQFGDKALSSFLGISTPASRVVNKGTAEFGQIFDLCNPHAPEKPVIPEGASTKERMVADAWRPLSDAESFVIMGEVPGKSVSSLLEKAPSDEASMAALYKSILDDRFVHEMGRVSLGDILLGNNDRMVGGGMNLGNIMVEMQDNGFAKLWAIDTSAVLGAEFDAKKIADTGSVSSTMQGAWENAKGDLKAGGAKVRIEGFYTIAIEQMREAEAKLGPKPEFSAVDGFEAAVKQRMPDLVSWFEEGWNSAMLDVYALLNTQSGREKMQGLTEEYEGTDGEEGLQYEALEMNAKFISSLVEGNDTEGASTQVAGEAAAKVLARFDPAAVAAPVDEYYWNVARAPSGAAYSADLEHPQSLLPPNDITGVVLPGTGNKYKAWDDGKLQQIGQSVRDAKVELQGLGTKKRGKKEVSRNRTVAGSYVADTYLGAGGAIRAVASGWKLMGLVENVAFASAANLTPQQATAALPAARFAASYLPLFEQQMDHFAAANKTASKNVGKIRSYDRKRELSDILASVARYVDEGKAKHATAVSKKDPSALVNTITAMTSGGTTTEDTKPKVEPSEKAKTKGRKPLIGSRGRK